MVNKSRANSTNVDIRILIVANHQIVRESLKCLLESNKDLTVTAVSSFEQIRSSSITQKDFDVGVVYLENGDPVEIIPEIGTPNARIRVVVVTAGEDLECSTRALKFGAVGVVRVEQSSKLLVEAIKQAYKGETWLNQALLSKLLEEGRSLGKSKTQGTKGRSLDALTPREIDVVSLIGKGLKSKIIAERLLISEATVRHHLSSIYGKLGIDDRVNLVIYAYEKGLLPLSDRPKDV